MRTNYVLIDLESVQPESLAALEQDHVKVMVFVGANQAKMPFGLARAIHRLGDKAEYIEIAGTGKNALDFHIAFYIGQLAAEAPSAYFHIISKDTGFDPLIKHLRSKKILSARSRDVVDIPFVRVGSTKSSEERAEIFIAKLTQPKATRPRSEKTLTRAIAALFQKQLTEPEIEAVIAAMRKKGFIDIANGKVSYAPSG